MKILITGATGFIGSGLVRALQDRIQEVKLGILVRNIEKAQQMLNCSSIDIIQTGEQMRKGIIDFNPDITVHLAAYLTEKSDSTVINKLILSNLLLSTQLLEAINLTSCKAFIHTGTNAEFAYGIEPYCNSLYSATKTAIRPIIKYYQSIGKWKWVNLIIYNSYGRRNPTCKKVIDLLIDSIDSNSPLPFSGGEQIRDFIHIDDIVDFIIQLISDLDLLEKDQYEFHIGTGQGHSIRQVAETIEKVYGKKVNAKWGFYPYRASESMHNVAPIGLNIKELGWYPKISLEEGIRIMKEDMENGQ